LLLLLLLLLLHLLLHLLAAAVAAFAFAAAAVAAAVFAIAAFVAAVAFATVFAAAAGAAFATAFAFAAFVAAVSVAFAAITAVAAVAAVAAFAVAAAAYHLYSTTLLQNYAPAASKLRDIAMLFRDGDPIVSPCSLCVILYLTAYSVACSASFFTKLRLMKSSTMSVRAFTLICKTIAVGSMVTLGLLDGGVSVMRI
jgi:hypothetical protein